MLLIITVLFFYQLSQATSTYIEESLDTIQQELDNEIYQSNNHLRVLKIHSNATSYFIQTTASQEIDAIINSTNTSNCLEEAVQFRKRIEQLNCNLEAKFEELETRLETVVSQFATLSDVARLSTDLCAKLNPLMSQAKSLDNCILVKIADLQKQTTIISQAFNSTKNELIEENDACIKNLMGVIYTDLSKIKRGVCNS